MSTGNKNALIVNRESMVRLGQAVAKVSGELQQINERAAAENAVALSFERAAVMMEMDRVLASPEVEAVVLHLVREKRTVEVCESDKQRMDDRRILEVCKSALCAGLLLVDPAGPHFAVMMGKSNVPYIKEQGFRFKLRNIGAKDVRVNAASLGIRARPNNTAASDMVLIGNASCTVQGKTYTVGRDESMPYLLPCYASDGPDKHEGQVRRRLLRDLWTAVSGESIEEEEPETPQQIAEQNTTELPRAEGVGTIEWHQGIYKGTYGYLENYINGIKQQDVQIAYREVLSVIHCADSAERLRERWDAEIVPMLRNQLKCTKTIGTKYHELMQARCGELEATA
jgi:hypothetical protein